MNGKTKKITFTGVFAALIFVATTFIMIPLGPFYINLGDTFILLCGVILGPFAAAASGGIGSALGDLATGYVSYAPATLVIKGLEGLLFGLLFRVLKRQFNPILSFLIASLPSLLWMVFGYFLTNIIYLGYSPALGATLFDLIQAGASMLAGVVIFAAVRRSSVIKSIMEERDESGVDK